jgi:hypothetical protein
MIPIAIIKRIIEDSRTKEIGVLESLQLVWEELFLFALNKVPNMCQIRDLQFH